MPSQNIVGKSLNIPFTIIGFEVVKLISPSKSSPFIAAIVVSKALNIIIFSIPEYHLIASSLCDTFITFAFSLQLIGLLKEPTLSTSRLRQYSIKNSSAFNIPLGSSPKALSNCIMGSPIAI